jgi:hypothetical protein
MANKKDRLLLESEVIAAVDKHTNNYNRLDDDITCILEDVKEEAFIITMKSEDYKGISNDLFIPPTSEVKKEENRFKTIRKVLDRYDKDISPNILRALSYAIHKDFGSDDIEEMMLWLKFFEHNFYSGSNFQELLQKQIEEELGE